MAAYPSSHCMMTCSSELERVILCSACLPASEIPLAHHSESRQPFFRWQNLHVRGNILSLCTGEHFSLINTMADQ